MPGLRGKTIELQPLITLRGETATFREIIQDIEDVLDTQGASCAIVRLEVRYCTDCTVYVEGAESEDSEFSTVVSQGEFTSVTPEVELMRLNRQVPAGKAGRLPNLLRWRVAADDGVTEWATTFRVTVTIAG